MAHGRDVQDGASSQVPHWQEKVCEHSEPRISVRVDQIIPWLANAASNGSAWLQDFEDEEICITSDLHDVILAYQHFHQR